jgi:ATP adenylyltransferase
MPYIEGGRPGAGCLFCEMLSRTDGPDNLILHRGPRAFVILNRFPYSNGHMMVVPHRHLASLEELEAPEQAELMALSGQAIRVLRQVYGAESFNLGINIGESAGAGILDHVHMHVLPRWAGDTSFMATTAETRVIPESLGSTYARLRPAWESIAKGAGA